MGVRVVVKPSEAEGKVLVIAELSMREYLECPVSLMPATPITGHQLSGLCPHSRGITGSVCHGAGFP